MNLQKLFPITITPNIKQCQQFYQKYFELTAVFEADWYIHLKHQSGTELAFMMPDLENQPKSLHAPYSGQGLVLSFEVADAKKEYTRLQELGAKFELELKDEEWGQRHCMLKDPSGMMLDIVQQL